MQFMLCGSMDTPENPLLDEEKVKLIVELEKTDLYIFEPKMDGTCGGLGKTAEGKITIPNRRGVDYATEHNLPELENTAAPFPADTLLHGEIVVMADPKFCDHKEKCRCKIGHPCRYLTQRRCGTRNPDKVAELKQKLPIIFVAWDIMRLAGEDLKTQPLMYRRKLLEELIDSAGKTDLVLIKYLEKNVVEMFKDEPEGIVAKLKTSQYVEMDSSSSSSNRVKTWLKIKHTFIEEREVAGYCSDGEGRLAGMLRNLVMVDSNGEYCGTVGGGFSDAERVQLKEFFDAQQTMLTAPYALAAKVKHRFVYVPSGLKVKVVYQEVTPAGILYAPRCLKIIFPFLGEEGGAQQYLR